MSRLRLLHVGIFTTLFIMFMNTTAYAQVPDWEYEWDERQRDSLAQVDYPYVFPFFGQQIVRKGFELPFPIGFSVAYFQQSSAVIIEELLVGIDDSPLMPLEFLEFEDVTNTARTMNTRLDLWLFPFLNIYGTLGYVEADAAVTIAAPFELEMNVPMDGWGYGPGALLAFGVKDFWVTANGNYLWTDLDAYDDPITARIASFRIGKSFTAIKNNRLQVWLGAMYQDVDTEVAGTFLLADLLPPEVFELLADYPNSEWYQDLNPIEKGFVDGLAARIQQGLEGAALSYEVVQTPKDDWNMLAGLQYEVTKRWYFQVEAGFLGSRTQVLTNVNYRFPL